MASNNTFYQSDILTIYPIGLPVSSGEIVETAQSIRVDTSYAHQNLSRLGKFGLNKYRPATEAPSIRMDVEYIPTGVNIFRNLGLLGDACVCDNLLSGVYKFSNVTLQQRNMYGFSNQNSFSFSSGVLTNFAFNVAVGAIPTAQFSYDFLSFSQDIATPVIQNNYSEAYVMTAKDIQISNLTGIIGVRDFNLTSFSISIPFGRNYQYRIGNVYPYSREVNAPVLATVQLNGAMAAYNALSSGYNTQIQRQQRGEYLNEDITVTLYKPTIAGEDLVSLGSFFISKPYVENISFDSSVGSTTNVSITLLVGVTPENNSTVSNVKIRQ